MNPKIRQYWENRAVESALSPDATTNDVYLRELEIKTLVASMEAIRGARQLLALDVGCGDGYSTISVAKRLPRLQIEGIDYSANMLAIAQERLASEAQQVRDRVRFSQGDVEQIEDSCGGRRFDVIMTDRCLINLDSFVLQEKAIRGLPRCLAADGVYLGIENFMGGQRALSAAREHMGLPDIPVRWHNLYFEEEDFLKVANTVFSDVRIENFASSYYFATRVLYSAMCSRRGETPDYQHDIHKLAVDLPVAGDFAPMKLVTAHR
jgi:ubiquinone/menaquinone biosynthesis C-methylase UbiE